MLPSEITIHTVSTKPWQPEQCIDKYAEAGVKGITFWRHDLDRRNPTELGQRARNAGLEITSLARGGFFPAPDDAGLATAIDDNLLAIDQATELGAPLLVLVCGALPTQSLDRSRGQIEDGISRILPYAMERGVKLAIEPLHPMYADCRSAISTISQANALCSHLAHPNLGIAADVYHTWWDPELEDQLRHAGQNNRLFAFHISDWRTPTEDLLNDRGIPGEGCIDIARILSCVRGAGFQGLPEVEIFSDRYWAANQDKYLTAILKGCAEISKG